MPYQTITLSSANVPGQSAPGASNWRGGKPMSVWVTPLTSTSSGNFSLQYTFDDPSLVGGTSVALWANVSSAIGQAGEFFNSSTCGTDGVFFQFLSPVAAVRLNSTSLSSGPLTMKILMGEGW